MLMRVQVQGRRKMMAGRWGAAEDVQVHGKRDRKVHRQEKQKSGKRNAVSGDKEEEGSH